MKNAPSWRSIAGIVLSIVVITRGVEPVRADADADGTVLPPEAALERTATTGVPTIMVVTSRSEARSGLLWAVMKTRLRDGGDWVLAELVGDEYPELVRYLGIDRIPTVLLFRKEHRGLSVTSRLVDPRDGNEVVSWARQNLEAAPVGPKTDTAMVRTQYGPDSTVPTPQTAAPIAPPTPAPARAVPPPPIAASLPALPVATAPASQAMVVPVPSPTVLVQPAAPTILIAQPPAPNVLSVYSPTVAYAAPAAPTVTPNLFLTAPSSIPAPATFAVPAVLPTATATVPLTLVPMIAAPAVPVAPAAAPAAPLVAIPPSRLGRFVGGLGEFLVRYKYPRVPGAITTTVLAPPTAAPLLAAPVAIPSVGVSPVPATALVPATSLAPANNPPGPPTYIPPPAAARPSSQR